ncbi:MAG: heparan-alpha-glucosaminide N-acetyltransferase domain-containing protein [Emticicia sp.]
MKRMTSIDVVRGLVMVIVALDHVRDVSLQNALAENSTDLASTYLTLSLADELLIFLLVFLSGVSAYISAQKQQNIKKINDFTHSWALVDILGIYYYYARYLVRYWFLYFLVSSHCGHYFAHIFCRKIS